MQAIAKKHFVYLSVRSVLSISLLALMFASYNITNTLLDKKLGISASTLDITATESNFKSLSISGEYESIFQMPLFDEDRQPPVVVVKKKIEKKRVNSDLRIKALGIALAGEDLLAVIKNLKNGKVKRLRINDIYNGWMLKSVSENKMVFTRNGSEKIIKFGNGGD